MSLPPPRPRPCAPCPGRTYHFTSDPLPLEGAKRMAAAGARMHKFRLSTTLPPEKAGSGGGSAGGRGGRRGGHAATLLDAAARHDMGYAQLFDLPFARWGPEG